MASRFVVCTDGSFSPQSGVGGWATVVEERPSGDMHVSSGFVLEGRSSSWMELYALVEGLRRVPTGAHAAVRLDAEGVVVTARARLRGGGGAPRSALWAAFDVQACRLGRVDLHWVRGHAGDAGNWKADHFAVGARRVGEVGREPDRDGVGAVVGRSQPCSSAVGATRGG